MLTRRQMNKTSLAWLAGGAALTMAPMARVFAQASSAAPLTADQKAVAERILQREVDRGIVPGIAWSIGNTWEILAEGAVGLRVVSPAVPVDAATRFAIASTSC